jgi:hypothetical protein
MFEASASKTGTDVSGADRAHVKTRRPSGRPYPGLRGTTAGRAQRACVDPWPVSDRPRRDWRDCCVGGEFCGCLSSKGVHPSAERPNLRALGFLSAYWRGNAPRGRCVRERTRDMRLTEHNPGINVHGRAGSITVAPASCSLC